MIPHDGFSWDKVLIVPNLCSYEPKSCNFKVFMYKYLFQGKNQFFFLIILSFFLIFKVFSMKKVLTHKNLKIASLRLITA